MGIVYYSSKTTVLADLLFSKTKVNCPPSSSVYSFILVQRNQKLVYLSWLYSCFCELAEPVTIAISHFSPPQVHGVKEDYVATALSEIFEALIFRSFIKFFIFAPNSRIIFKDHEKLCVWIAN